MLTGFHVVYDTHYALTPAQLANYLYSGYFDGFNESQNTLVIVELRTMQPPESLLNNLFWCLDSQGCKIIFISPYLQSYSDLNYLFATMPCEYDPFIMYIKQSVRSVWLDCGSVDGLILFLDGRLIGLETSIPLLSTSYTIKSLLNNSAFRRLLSYLRYGCAPEVEVLFEEDMYESAWEYYADNSLRYQNSDLVYYYEYGNYNDYEVYSQAIESAYEYNYGDDNDLPHHYENNISTQYKAILDDATEAYYTAILDFLREKDIHIFVNVFNTSYIDVLDMPYIAGNTPATTYIFTNYASVTAPNSGITVAGHPLYMMSQYYMTSYMYNLTYSIIFEAQNTDEYALVKRCVYLWEVDEFVDTGSGLPCITHSSLRASCGGNLDDEGTIIDDPESTGALFTNTITSALSSFF